MHRVSYFWKHVRTMLGPCLGHVLLGSTSRLDIDMKFSRLSQHGPRPMSMEFLCSRPCKDHVETMLGLVFLPDQLEHWNFQDWVSMVQGPCLESVYLRGQCQDHVRTMFGLTLLLDPLEQWNFHPWDNMVKSLCLWSVYFSEPVRTMLGPCFA